MKFSFRLPAILLVTSLCLPWVPGANAEGANPAAAPAPLSSFEVTIPGPLRSFMRMAGISQKVSREEVMPLLARNVFSQGYQAGRPTEFLILLNRYVQQARELTELAGTENVIRVTNCEDAKPLLAILGYRARMDCGHPGTSLVTADAEKAFVTIDSGFPLPDLEVTLQGGKPFAYPYSSSHLPAISKESDWITGSREKNRYTKDLVDAILRDHAMARLYWALSRSEPQTREILEQSPGIGKLLLYPAVLDFYGTHLSIRSGRVTVPGGPGADAAWKDVVGASPDSPGEFVFHLMAKDRGWLAAYFDALSRVNQTRQAYFTDPKRLRRNYEAFRGNDMSTDAARPSFRPAPGLLLLLTRLHWNANGDPDVPGSLDVWKDILSQKNESKLVREWGKKARHLNSADQLVEAMFGISRVETDSGPLQAYLALSELDSLRPPDRHLSPETVRAMAGKFEQFSDQYLMFSEFPAVDDAGITTFISVAESVSHLPNHTLRGNAMGSFQAVIGIWQILARQGEIAPAEQSASWQSVITPFAKVGSAPELFDATRDSLIATVRSGTGKPNVTEDAIIDLLAGPHQLGPDAVRIHQEMATRIRSVLDGQRLVSLDTLLALGLGLNELAHGSGSADNLVPLAGELREFEMPRPIFTSSEHTEWAAGTYNNRHTELQMKTDLGKMLKGPHPRAQLEEARGQLTPFLRDTLVGLNYAYYEPPGAQVMHNNPLLVRSHDFSGDTVAGVERLWQASQVFGEGTPAGGGAHLVGSLADLPYVLATMEQDFIAPENIQALIWRELVPGLMISATLPRWWGVSRNELHAVALYQQAGEELITAAAGNEDLRRKVLDILSDRMAPQRLGLLEQALISGRLTETLPRVMPADTFFLAVEFHRKYPDSIVAPGPATQELDSLSHRNPEDTNWERLSQDFGVPHPILTQNYARELLNVKPFPAFQGYSSRLLAETWDSNNLYWARLADEKGYSPVILNRLVPELTHRMVEKIFATEFEDWPALLRAMREAGEEFRQGKIASLPPPENGSQQ